MYCTHAEELNIMSPELLSDGGDAGENPGCGRQPGSGVVCRRQVIR